MDNEVKYPILVDCFSDKKYSLANKIRFLVGRSEDADLPVLNESCSRKQFQLDKIETSWFLYPISESNPTYCNGIIIKSKISLSDGSIIQVGTNQFKFLEQDDSNQILKKEAVLQKPDIPFTFEPPRDGTVLAYSRDTPEIIIDKKIKLSEVVFFGREAAKVNVHFDHPQVSRVHSQITKNKSGFTLTDLRSANGTFVNGKKIENPTILEIGDKIDIGPFSLQFDGISLIPASREGNIEVIALSLSRVLSSGRILLDDITFAIKPKEMIALIGPSGSGKTTLLSALSARQPADSGSVLLNNRDLYSNFENLKQDLIVVPQRELLFEQLTVEKMLYYTAKLRLPPDTSNQEIDKLVNEMLETTKMLQHKKTVIHRLSGGQRKRIVLANELLSKPSLIFLDEVTSGLDEQSDKDLMNLFRSLTESGKTVVCITHSLGQVESTCHLVCILTEGGKLAFLGSPQEALNYFKVTKLGDIYEVLSQKDPSTWQNDFLSSPEYLTYIKQRVPQGASIEPINVIPRPSSIEKVFFEICRQLSILVSRQFECLLSDKKALLALIAQPILVSILLILLFNGLDTKGKLQQVHSVKELFFLTQICCFWFGCNNASKEIIKDRLMFKRERDFNLSIISFYFSKFLVFTFISLLQSFLVLFAIWHFCSPPGILYLASIILFIVSMAGTALGLAISVFSNTETTAVNVIPLALIPQIMLSGLIAFPLKGLALLVGQLSVTSYWGYQAMLCCINSDLAEFDKIIQDNFLEILGVLVVHVFVYSTVGIVGMYFQERRDITFVRALLNLAKKNLSKVTR